MYDLNGQVAIVTGAGRGIGRAIAMRLALEGAAIVAADVDRGAAEKVIQEVRDLGKQGLSLAVDVSIAEDVERITKGAMENFGQIDILVNNAGAGSCGLIIDLSEEDWEKSLRVNLKGTFLCSRAVAKAMMPRKKGRIINIASIAGKSGEEYIGAYCASKFGIIGLTQVLAKELGRHLITVNAVCPGYIWTSMWENLGEWFKENFPALADLSPREVFERRVKAVTPLRRPQTPDDIASLVAFLVSREAGNITGQAISVDGGAVMR
jgi:NAD(P)-dependent dehydrogenase (short-subunit alcohol dehydrogenase family)